MRETVTYRRGRFLVTQDVDLSSSDSPAQPPDSSPSGSSSRGEFTPGPPPSSGLHPRLPDRQQSSSSRQPDSPKNTVQNPPAVTAPRSAQKRKLSHGQLGGEEAQNLAAPVTRTRPAGDSLRLTEKGKQPKRELARIGGQEQQPSFRQIPQSQQLQQPPILHDSQPQQQLQLSPFPSFVRAPLIFQHPQSQQQEQQQQFSSFPPFVQQFSPSFPLIFQSHPAMAFSTSQPQQQPPSLFQITSQPQQQQQPLIFQAPQPQQQQQPSIFQTPQPQQQQQQPSIFQTPQPQQQPSIFQTSQPQPQQQQPSIFQTPQPQQQQQQFLQFPSFVQQPQYQFQPQQQNVQFQPQQQNVQFQPPPPQQLMLFTADGSPASSDTKFVDLHPDSQKLLLQIEERILEYRAESERLDQCLRLFDSSVSNDSFERDANRILQELKGITSAIEREKVSVQDLRKKVNDMMRYTEFVVRSYMMLRPRLLRPSVPAASGIGSSSQTVGAAGTSGQTNQPMTSPISASFDFYSGIPKRPSPFMHHTAARFEEYLTGCCRWIEELEQLVLMDTDKTPSNPLETLPRLMSNVYDYFMHVAGKVENIHQYVESMKTAYLADRRRRGDGSDPFLEADRREEAQQEAAARRVHPTLHPPATCAQPATQAAGIFAGTAASTSSAPQLFSGTNAAASFSGGFSIFSSPSAPSASTSSSFLFSAPTAPAQSSSLFGSAGFAPQSTPFGTASTSLFGSTLAPSGFGTNAASSSTPALGSTPLFATPSFGTGAATGSGASFGAAPKSPRSKSRSTRR